MIDCKIISFLDRLVALLAIDIQIVFKNDGLYEGHTFTVKYSGKRI